MAQDNERPRAHGDPLRDVVDPNPVERQSDAVPDAPESPDELADAFDRAGAQGSTANGIPAFDEKAGEERRKLYEEGAELVSRID